MSNDNTPLTGEQMCDEIARFIADSRALLAGGAVLELAGLEERVRDLCERAILSPQEERGQYAERLAPLLEDLSALERELRQSRDEVAEEIRHAATHRKASNAYLTTNAVDGGGKKEEE